LKENSKILVGVILGGNYLPKNYTFDTEEEASEFVGILGLAKNVATSKGQFYI
jgi:hypothetical protein